MDLTRKGKESSFVQNFHNEKSPVGAGRQNVKEGKRRMIVPGSKKKAHNISEKLVHGSLQT